VLGRQRARDRAAADAAQSEVVGLFAQKVDDTQPMLQFATAVADAPRQLDGGEHPKRTVEPTAARDGVSVRPRDKQATGRTGQRSHQVAGSVLLDREAGIAHPRSHPVA
jgi:hypothetical protein